MPRGYPAPKYRAGVRYRPQSEATAMSYSLPAPYQGWNARGNIANMSPIEAIQMDNVFPGVTEVFLRKGRIEWATGFAANVKTLIAYSGASVNKLFAANASGIFDVTGSGAIGAAVTACTNGFWSYVNFANSGGNWLCMCNGTDAYKTYDGTTWTTPAITGVAGTSLNYVTMHQRRLWFAQSNTMKLWYLAADAISGAATLFDVGPLFKRGGYVVALGTWTIDSGAGSNDQFVIVTSNGEIAIYQGTDPASSTTWALVGVYDVARPLGNRPLYPYGGDLLYLSRAGIYPLSSLMQSSDIQRSRLISYKIDGAILDAAEAYGTNFGWQMVTHKTSNMLILNVPVSADTVSYQFVMNTLNQAWCRFTNWNASCWATLGDDLYYAGGLTVSKAWVGPSDNNSPIIGQVAQAYGPLGYRGQKNITLARPNIAFSSSAVFNLALDADFKTFNGQTQITYQPVSEGSLWSVDLWGTGIWDSSVQVIDPKWTTIPGDLGFLHSLKMQITSSTSDVTWTSTDFAFRPAGIL